MIRDKTAAERERDRQAKQAPDDDDDSAMWGALRAMKQDRRRDNTISSTQLLTEKGVKFTAHNNGAHLIVEGKWNFWPSTGLYSERSSTKGQRRREGRGVFNLLKILGVPCSKNPSN